MSKVSIDGDTVTLTGPLDDNHVDVLFEIVDASARLYRGNGDDSQLFLLRPHPMLDGQAPFVYAFQSLEAAQRVLNLINKCEAGVAV